MLLLIWMHHSHQYRSPPCFFSFPICQVYTILLYGKNISTAHQCAIIDVPACGSNGTNHCAQGISAFNLNGKNEAGSWCMTTSTRQDFIFRTNRSVEMLSSIGSLFIYIPVQDTHNPQVHLPAVDNWSSGKKHVSNDASGVRLVALVTSFQEVKSIPGCLCWEGRIIHPINVWKRGNTTRARAEH